MHDRRTRNALALCASLVVATLVSTSAVHAAPSSADKARAAELFKKGSDAYLKGDFATTIANLEEAHKLDPQPVLIYNEARAHEGLGHTDEAIKLYEQYLSEEPSSPDRGAIEQRVATLKKQRDDKVAAEKERAAIEKERSERAVAPPPEPPRKYSKLPYVVGGVGVAGLAAGVVFGLMASGKESDGESAKTQRDAIDARDTGSTFATVANVSFVVGGVLLAAGAVWWALDHGGSRKATAFRLGPAGVGGTF